MNNGHGKPERSLQDIMNVMARRVSNIDGPATRPARSVLSEADAYARFDIVLGQLLKNYNDAQAGRKRLCAALGPADAMTVVADDMVNTCRGMIEARLVELRANPMLRAQAEDSLALAGVESGMAQNEKMRGYADHMRREQLERKKQDAQHSGMWMFFLLWMLQETVRETQRRLSAVTAFSAASHSERRYAAA